MSSNKIIVKDGNLDKALRQFKVAFAKSGVPSELKKRRNYEKPGVKRRNEKKQNIQNCHKRNRRSNRNNK